LGFVRATFKYKGLRLYADLGAEQPIAAERLERKIVIEIKVFGTPSPVTELERAIGQYSIYRMLLAQISPERELFLAIAQDIYEDFFHQPAIQDIVAAHQMRLLVFEPMREDIIAWIS